MCKLTETILKIKKKYQTGVFVVILQKCIFFQLWVLKPDQPTDTGPISSQFLNSLHSFKKEILITRRNSKDSSIHFPSHGIQDSYTIIQRWEKKEQVYSRTVPSIILGHSGLYFSFKTTDKKKKEEERHFHALCCSYASTYHNHNCEPKSLIAQSNIDWLIVPWQS